MNRIQFEIRTCSLEDADAIQALNQQEMGYAYPKECTKQKLQTLLNSPKDKIFVAVANGTVVGYVHANDYELLYAPSMKNIMGIAVASEYQRSGIGRALLEEAEAWARDCGASGVRLVSGGTRTDAHAFYRACGYDGGKQQLNFKKWFIPHG